VLQTIAETSETRQLAAVFPCRVSIRSCGNGNADPIFLDFPAPIFQTYSYNGASNCGSAAHHHH
jgi:hypothetical protein